MTEATATTTTTVTPPAAEQAYWSGFDDETKGYLQNKGLTTKPIGEALVAVSKFHREAEKMIGAPANEMVRLPKDANSPDWKQVWNRLGVPNDPKDYDLSTLKRAGDKPVDEALADTLRKAFVAGNVTKDKAIQTAQEFAKYLDGIESARIADQTAKLDEEKKLLKDNWGAHAPANTVIAQGAASTLFQALGMQPDAVKAALENMGNAIGYSKVMDLFRLIGTKIGEDRFVLSAGGNSTSGVMTKEQAIAEKASLKNDEAWVKRYLKGGQEELRKMGALDRIISGVAT